MRTALLTILLLATASLPVWASADPEAIAVLDREHLWLKAIATRNAALLGTILAENFVHINYRGEIAYREQELANVVKPKPDAHVTTEKRWILPVTVPRSYTGSTRCRSAVR